MNENRTLQAAKMLAAVFVVFIHCTFPDAFGQLVQALARFAVPLFFCVGGRFLFPADASGRLLLSTAVVRDRAGRRTLRILRTALFLLFIYTGYSLIYRLHAGETLAVWASDKYNPGEWFTFFLFQSGKVLYDYSYSYDHLWYVFALVYVFALIWALAPVVRRLYKPVTVLLLLGLFAGVAFQIWYPIRPFDISIRTWYMLRNWLLMGLPFTGLGIWSVDGLPGLTARGDASKAKSVRMRGWILIAAGAVLAAAEFIRFDSHEISVGSFLTVLGILALADAEDAGAPVRIPEPFVAAGRALTADIYYWHILIYALIQIIGRPVDTVAVWLWLRPVAVLLLSVLWAAGLNRVRGLARQQSGMVK